MPYQHRTRSVVWDLDWTTPRKCQESISQVVCVVVAVVAGGHPDLHRPQRLHYRIGRPPSSFRSHHPIGQQQQTQQQQHNTSANIIVLFNLGLPVEHLVSKFWKHSLSCNVAECVLLNASWQGDLVRRHLAWQACSSLRPSSHDPIPDGGDRMCFYDVSNHYGFWRWMDFWSLASESHTH